MLKEIKLKKCRVCPTMFKPFSTTSIVCSPKCAQTYAEAKRIKQEANLKRVKRKKTKEALNDIKNKSEWLKDAQRWFNKYIRLRDGTLPCISCQRYHTGQYHAGHYRTIGSAPHLRFNELNVHKQCAPCNNHLSGNIINYRPNLINKIGIDALEQLESDNTPKHYSIDDIKEIKRIYQQKVKEMRKP